MNDKQIIRRLTKELDLVLDENKKLKEQLEGKWVSVDDFKPEAHQYVLLKHKSEEAPPTVGYATYWQPKNEFACFEVVCSDFFKDYDDQFTHWTPIPN